ncbi:unnamed protein product [Enterobius vermicularis]|uniref:ANTH domain-containing protein n=1 Tax=Enterobius vermicularis TaxID=51028 RepID=A0A0N4UZX4_ENTVE|nr:unnamed protein product [Enterobius vermicularis]
MDRFTFYKNMKAERLVRSIEQQYKTIETATSRQCFATCDQNFDGSLHLSDKHFNASISGEVDYLYGCCLEMLDQLDKLLHLQSVVLDVVGKPLERKSQTGQGQCLLAPIALVIVDVSILYRHLLQFMFKLRQEIAADAFRSPCNRFHSVYLEMKAFFETASTSQYLQSLVKVPGVPETEPTFLNASSLDHCLISEATEVFDSGVRFAGENKTFSRDSSGAKKSSLLRPESSVLPQQIALQGQQYKKEFEVKTLRGELEDARRQKEELMDDARSRIEQYEKRLTQLEKENDLYKKSLENLKACARIEECEEKLRKAKEEDDLQKKKLNDVKKTNEELRRTVALAEKKNTEVKSLLEKKRECESNLANMQGINNLLELKYKEVLCSYSVLSFVGMRLRCRSSAMPNRS